ncbi:MAG: hypothetical protein IPN96_00615 [Anaerolineales bacterium]|uniref:hypothetical protein n=1 Tax=Candidatus Villigracilis proximus TaxID=3140683 RepID=UPI003134AF61|nr:hypothetical protein [Anaerolineales bacterium]MBK8824555.1 hypothetical protein [Anaerolineales bacterium]MBK9207917.1 hypothetical protein [Anaerolineales bacterium]
MNEFLAIPLVSFFIFNWPLYVIALLFGVIGVMNRQWGLVLLSAVLILPFTYVLNGISPFAGFSLLLPIFHIGSAVATKDDNETWAWVLLAPTFVIRMWLLMVAVVKTMP